jgi:signal transduction histidine kinase
VLVVDLAFYKSVLAALPAGLLAVDGAGRVVAGNPALERLLGCCLEDLAGRSLPRILEERISHPGQLLPWIDALDDALAHRRVRYLNLPVEFLTGPEGDGGRVQLVGTVAPWEGPEGAQPGAVVLLHDSMLHSDLEGIRARFLAVVAHELGSPVANISTAAERIGRDPGSGMEERRRLQEIILVEARRLGRLLTLFLAASPPEADAFRTPWDIVTLPPLVRRVAHTFGIRDSGHPIVLELPDDLPFVRGDADRVEEVLGNLIDNAYQHTPRGTKIVLSARAQDSVVVVRVTDQGPDLPPATDERLFGDLPWRPYGSPGMHGHGLGLPVARALIRGMGGELWYEEEPAGAKSFCFRLPRVEEFEEKEEKGDGAESHGIDCGG